MHLLSISRQSSQCIPSVILLSPLLFALYAPGYYMPQRHDAINIRKSKDDQNIKYRPCNPDASPKERSASQRQYSIRHSSSVIAICSGPPKPTQRSPLIHPRLLNPPIPHHPLAIKLPLNNLIPTIGPNPLPAPPLPLPAPLPLLSLIIFANTPLPPEQLSAPDSRANSLIIRLSTMPRRQWTESRLPLPQPRDPEPELSLLIRIVFVRERNVSVSSLAVSFLGARVAARGAVR